jgi:hypothetical protein
VVFSAALLLVDPWAAFFVGFLPLVGFLVAAFFLIAFLGGMILVEGQQEKYQLSFYKKMINMISITNWMESTELTELDNNWLRSVLELRTIG